MLFTIAVAQIIGEVLLMLLSLIFCGCLPSPVLLLIAMIVLFDWKNNSNVRDHIERDRSLVVQNRRSLKTQQLAVVSAAPLVFQASLLYNAVRISHSPQKQRATFLSSYPYNLAQGWAAPERHTLL